MKTIYITTFLCFIVLSGTFGQANNDSFYILRDAKRLKSLKGAGLTTDGQKKEFEAIIKRYTEDITKNPFYESSHFDSSRGVSISRAEIEQESTLANKLAVTPLESFESNAINGIAMFMEKRFRQELAAYFVKELRDRLENDPMVQNLFPRTYKFLELFSESVYTTDFTLFKLAAEEDFRNMKATIPKSLLFIAQNPKYKSRFNISKESAEAIGFVAVVVQIVSLIDTKKDLGNILNNLPTIKGLPDNIRDYVSIIRTTSNALYDPDQKQYYKIGKIDFNQLSSNSEVRYFCALLYERLRLEKIKEDELIVAIKNKDTNEQKELVDAFNEIFDNIQKLSNISPSDTFLERITVIHRTSVDVISLINKLSSTPLNLPKWVENEELVRAFIRLADTIEQVANAPSTDTEYYKQYGKILSHLVFLLNDVQGVITNDKEKANATLATIIRNLTILAQIAEIKKAEDMANVLESAALPVGSSSIKRNAKFNLALNGYVGVNAGKDWYGTTSKWNLGITAPIGLSFSGSNMTKSKGVVASHTFFLSFLDLGNLVNVRLQSSGTEINGLKFKYFQYYGFGYFVNFRKSPFSLGVHGGYMPGFTDVMIDNITINKSQVWKANLMFLVDIPFFNLKTSRSKLD